MDITLCTNEECPYRKSCRRGLNCSDTHQSYMFVDWENCEYWIPFLDDACVECRIRLKAPKRKLCRHCIHLKKGNGKKNRHKYAGYEKLDYCEKCGYDALHSCQLDVHHKDGDSNNYDTGNVETLCANCHRLVSLLERHTVPGKKTH